MDGGRQRVERIGVTLTTTEIWISLASRWNNGVQPSIVIYRNDGAGILSPITAATLDYDEASPRIAIWGDYDNDGWLDFFCVTYRSGCLKTIFSITTTEMAPSPG